MCFRYRGMKTISILPQVRLTAEAGQCPQKLVSASNGQREVSKELGLVPLILEG